MEQVLVPFSRDDYEQIKASLEAAGYTLLTRWRPGVKHLRLVDIVLTPEPEEDSPDE